MTPWLRAAGLRVRRGRRLVLRGAGLEAARGELVAVLGPNGAGKTTLLEAIAGALEPEEGEITIAGRLAYSSRHRVNLPPEERLAALVPQDHAVYPHMTVYENIALGPRAQRLPETEARRLARWAAELLGVDHLLDRPASQLSGGERQRVAIARALAARPNAVLLDEPFSALDPEARSRLLPQVLHALREARATAILVTHSLEEALAADRVYILSRGRTRGGAPPAELLATPLRHGAAQLLGYNVLEATATGPTTAHIPGLGEIHTAHPHSQPPGTPLLIAIPQDAATTPPPSGEKRNTYTLTVAQAQQTPTGLRLTLQPATGTPTITIHLTRAQLAAANTAPRPGATITIHIPPALVDAAPRQGRRGIDTPTRHTTAQ